MDLTMISFIELSHALFFLQRYLSAGEGPRDFVEWKPNVPDPECPGTAGPPAPKQGRQAGPFPWAPEAGMEDDDAPRKVA
jgi:hypothetical protein